MKLRAGIFSAADRPSHSPDSDFWYTPLGGKVAGMRVNAESAMRTSAVFACVRIIAETVGSLPLITYKRLARGKARAPQHPLYKLLRYKPNRYQTSIEFVEMLTGHAALRGNGYARKVHSRAGKLEELIPLHPDRMQVDELPDGRLGYLYTDRVSGRQVPYHEQDIFHLRGFSLDGRVGMSVIGYAAHAIGVALAADDYGARFFENDATPGGVLKHPSHFADKEKRKEFVKQWQSAQSGANRGKTAVLEDGMEYETIGLTNRDAQFLETKRYQVEDICRIFRVPLVLVGETTKSTSWGSGVEQFMISFMTHTMRPWLVRWEQRLQLDFLDDEDLVEDEYFAEFLVEAMLRGDTAARFESYSKSITAGWLTRNEAREAENKNPLPGLDEPLQPVNMTQAGAEPQQSPRPNQPQQTDEREEEIETEEERDE